MLTTGLFDSQEECAEGEKGGYGCKVSLREVRQSITAER